MISHNQLMGALKGIGYKDMWPNGALKHVRFHIHGNHDTKFRNYTYTDGAIMIQKDFSDSSGSTYNLIVSRDHIAETSRGSLTCIHSYNHHSMKIKLQSTLEDTLSEIEQMVQSLINDSMNEIKQIPVVDYIKITYSDTKKENS